MKTLQKMVRIFIFNVIYICQIPSAWVCQEQFENIYQQMQFRAKHRNPMKCKIQIQASSIASECSPSVFDRSHLPLFKPFLLVINHSAEAFRWLDYSSFLEWKTWKSDKSCSLVCVEKATLTGKVKSDMSSNRAPGQRMMICQLGSDISQLQGVTSERGCHAKLYFLKGGEVFKGKFDDKFVSSNLITGVLPSRWFCQTRSWQHIFWNQRTSTSLRKHPWNW